MSKNDVFYTVSKRDLGNKVFITVPLPNGKVAKIMNRRVFEEALKAASRVKKLQ